MNVQGIDIATVLRKLDETYDEANHQEKFYGLKFIDRHGKTHQVTARKHVISPQLKPDKQQQRGKQQYNLQRNGTIHITESGATHPITPKACMIFGFRDYNSTTWLNVFH